MKNSNICQQKNKEIRSNIRFGNLDLAKQQIDEYIEAFGTDCYVELETARYYRRLKDYDKAVEILCKIINNKEKNIGYALFELGKLYQDMKEYEKAIEAYKQIEETNHQDKSYALLALGMLYEKTYKYNEAIECLKKVIKASDELSEKAKYYLGRCYLYNRQYDNARKVFNSIITINDSKTAKLIQYYDAKIDNNLGLVEEYEEKIERLINTYPNFNAALAEKVRILLNKKRYSECEQYIRRIKPESYDDIVEYDTILLQCEYYEKTNQFEKALEMYKAALVSETTKVKPLYDAKIKVGLGFCCVGLGKIDKGYEYFLQEYKNDSMFKNMCLFNLISIDLYRKNYEKAKELFMEFDQATFTGTDYMNMKTLKISLEKAINGEVTSTDGYNYRDRQIANYSKSSAVDHIHYGHSKKMAPANEGSFHENADIGQLMEEIKYQLTDENIVTINILSKYKIQYENIGEFNGRQLDYLVVVTIPHTNEIITMYPTNEYLEEQIEEIEIPKKEEPEKQKVIKRESQIEKFNRRYNLK